MKLFTLFNQNDGTDRPLLAIVLLLTGVLTLSLQDALVKLVSSDTSIWQFQTLRSAFNICILLVLASLNGGLSLLLPINHKPVLLRAFFLTICMFCFFAGAPHLSVAQMGAGLYTYPIFVSLLAGPVLGETIGIWRISSIILGMTGAAFILQPWQESFSWIQVLPVLAGFFFACNVMTLRKACRRESTLALAFAVGVVFLSAGILGSTLLSLFPPDSAIQQAQPFIVIGWPELSLLVVGFAMLASLLNLTGNISLTRAYQTADASLLAPLDFSYLLFAALWGQVLFGKWPDGFAWLGIALVINAGMLTAWREQVASNSKPNQL